MNSITEILGDVKAELGGQLNGRIERAAALALAGGVTRLSDYSWQVASQTEAGKSYTVSFQLQWVCDCEDFLGTGHSPAPIVELGGNVGPVCKHILSVFACWASGTYPSPKPAPLYDLCICTRKRPFTTGSEDYEILWYKRAGADKVTPTGKKLTDSDIQKALGKYRLVGTEARQSQVIRRYQLAGGA